MEHKFLPKIYGVVKDFHPRMIPEDKASDALNVVFKQGRVRSRWGYSAYGRLPLNGPITNFVYYEQLSTGLRFTIVFTDRDAYLYNTDTGQYEYITPIYVTGHAACAGGTTAVVGAGTTWNFANWPPNGVCQIKFGTSDPNAAGTPDTWYDISSFSTADDLTLSTNGPNTSGNVDYVIRVCWSGDDSDYHAVALPYSDTDGEKVIVVTNGVDPIRVWNGTGYFTDLGGSPRKAKFIGYFGSVGYEHLVTAWTNDGTYNLPQSIEVSDAGTIDSWPGTYYDLLNSNDEIKGIVPLGTHLIIYKKNSITDSWPNASGGNVDPFDFNENKVRDIGTWSIRTVCDMGGYHIFFGTDNIYKYDGSNVNPIGSEVINTLMSEVTKKYLHKSFAIPLRDEGLYCLFVPTNDSEYCNKTYVYNYAEQTWTIWELYNNITAYGVFTKEYAPTWDDIYDSGAGPIWSDMYMRWRDLIVYDNNLSFLLGDKDGYVYEFSPDFFSDNGTVFECGFTTADHALNDPKRTFRLNEAVIGITDQDAGEFRVRASVDFGENWSDWISLTLDGAADYFEAIANFVEKGRQVRFEVDNGAAGSRVVPIEIESINIGWNDGGIIK